MFLTKKLRTVPEVAILAGKTPALPVDHCIGRGANVHDRQLGLTGQQMASSYLKQRASNWK
jgi:hypothetical protein